MGFYISPDDIAKYIPIFRTLSVWSQLLIVGSVIAVAFGLIGWRIALAHYRERIATQQTFLDEYRARGGTPPTIQTRSGIKRKYWPWLVAIAISAAGSAYLTYRLTAQPTPTVAKEGETPQAMQAENRQLQADLSAAKTQLNTAQSSINSLGRSRSEAYDEAGNWQQRYLDLVAQIAGKDFSDEFARAALLLDGARAHAKETDAELAAYQERWKKHEVGHPPIASQTHDDDAHHNLSEAQQIFDRVNSRWQSMLAAAKACIKK